jgi:polyribonucleotide nucleotidyltransferase
VFDIKTIEVPVGGGSVSLETGRFARQADGAVMVRMGDTMVLVTAVMSKSAKPGDFLPLSVEYQEKTYSTGRIPGGYFKRENRPTELEILTSRIIDRPIRPLFDDHCRFEIQVVATVVSMDKENDPGLCALLGASAALMISNIPWDGPVAAVRVGRIDDKLVLNPKFSEMEKSTLDITVVVGRDGVVMVEGQGQFVSEEVMVEALMFAQKEAQPMLVAQEQLARELAPIKREIPQPQDDKALEKRIIKLATPGLKKALTVLTKHERYAAVAEVKAKVLEDLGEEYAGKGEEIGRHFKHLQKKMVRDMVFNTGKRLDGRTTTEVRPIDCQVGVLPRVHGSALFTRGETQALVAITLGTSADEQRLETLMGEEVRSYLLHYNFPSFSVGEVKPMRGPSRRDTGHGKLAERGTKRILPAYEQFPYTIRSVSEILESNGSSSMATVCGTCLGLMDAGVPITEMVAGIAMGLMKEDDKVAVLTDILGDEDHLGDMDFKVIGGDNGITAIQMDIKISGLSREILTKSLNQARDARLHILGKMREALTEPRSDLSAYAPRITTIHINPDRIRDLIGPGGKNIKGIIEATGASIDVTDDGTVRVAAIDPESGAKALALVKGYTEEAEIGKIYYGKVVKITDFGAFVNIMPGTDGLCHISEMARRRVKTVDEVMHEGDEVPVKVLGVDEKNGKIRLSHIAALEDLGKA